MTLQEFCQHVLQAQQKLQRQRFKGAVRRIIHQTSLMISGICIAMLLNKGFLSLWMEFHLSRLAVRLILLAVLLSAVARLVLQGFAKVDCSTAIRELDRISNRHNLISTAHEFLEADKDSIFAQYAVSQGVEALQDALKRDMKPTHRPLNISVVAAACIAAMDVSLLSGHAVNAASNDEPKVSTVSSAAKISLKQQPKKIDTVSNDTTAENGTLLSARQHKTAQGQIISSTAFAQASAAANQTQASGGVTSDMIRQKSNTMKRRSASTNLLRTAGFKGAGAGQTPPTETSIKSNSLNIGDGLYEDQRQAAAKDKDTLKTFENSSRRPFLSDRRSAPGRELGRSGKKDKPGNGRGGLGAVKKSRSTAALFPGRILTVHVPSQPGKGKSKSFEAEAPLKPEKAGRTTELSTADSREERVRTDTINPEFKKMTQQYFEELNAYSNRMLKESPSAD